MLSYCRVFVGYDSVDDPSEYTIYVKYVEIENTPENVEILSKYGVGGKKECNKERADDGYSSDNASGTDTEL